MPIPRRVARWNKVGLNRVVRHIAPWMPGLGLVVHRGRRSGREYQTPVNVFPADEGFVIALTYGGSTPTGCGTSWPPAAVSCGPAARSCALTRLASFTTRHAALSAPPHARC